MALKLFGSKNETTPDVAGTESSTIIDIGTPRSAPAAAETEGSLTSRLRRLGIVFAILAATSAGLLVHQGRQAVDATLQVSASSELQTLSQQIAKSAQLALRGNQAAIAELDVARNRFKALLQALEEGGAVGGTRLPAVPAAIRPQLQQLGEAWRQTERNSEELVQKAEGLVALGTAASSLERRAAELALLGEQIAAYALRSGASASEIAAAHSLVPLVQRIAAGVRAMQAADAIDTEVAMRFGLDTDDLRAYNALLLRMPADGELRRQIAAFDEGLQPLLKTVVELLGDVQPLTAAKQAGSQIFEDSVPLLARSAEVTEALTINSRGFSLMHGLAAVSALLAVLVLVQMVRAYGADLAGRRQETDRQRQSAENDRNLTQQAILRLMNEMGDLADGDLTIRATVTEDITGAIADSVNYTIEELSVLVRRINDAASRVTAATESARHTSTELLAATERQSQEIEEAGTTAERMAQSMTDSSERALQSAQVARRSLDAARKGADAVENTIRGMNDIRAQIQETAKRIKRLGESSQEIGEIVELISDITEQTNVLALNAAIQAASAGEAGRGFTVVAEEVQRLAERSAEATKHKAANVKTIQTDTQDAVGAMENATRNVVEGAQLSDAAGQALAEIGEVSTETARLIERISADTQEQAATAGRVAATMKDILAVTEQTSLGTRQTAVSIGQLAELAVELKGSVSGFKV